MSSSFLFCYKHFYMQNLFLSFLLLALYHLTEVLLILVNFMSQYLSYRLSKRTVTLTQGLGTLLWVKVGALVIHKVIVPHFTEYGFVLVSGYLSVT